MKQQAIHTGKQQAWQLIAKGRHTEAIALLRNVLRSAPNDAEAQYVLGCGHANLGQWNEAITALQSSIRLQPRVPQSHFALAGAWIALGQQDKAINSLQTTLELDDTMTQAHVALANLQITQGDSVKARGHLERALALDPNMIDAHLSLGRIEQEHGEHDKALPHFERALKSNPRNLNALCAMATSLANLTRKKDAEAYYRKALQIDPDCPEALCGLAMIHNFNGEFAKAAELIDPLLQKKTVHPALATAFVQCCKYNGRCEEAIDYINQVLQQPGLAGFTIKSLHFVAGKVLDDMGQYDAAFAHYKAGNEAMKPLYDSVAHTQHINDLIRVFTPMFFMKTPRARNEDKRPVFIVGMPRSGTSLTEQILAAHPRVHAAGELYVLSNITKQMRLELGCNEAFPFYLDKLSQDNIDAMARAYLAQLTGLSSQADRVTDKMPHNFYLLGLMQLLFPGARIIHCQRDPMDTCLSIYFQDFHEKHKFAKDLFSIGTHYHQYRRLMEYWKQVITLPLLDLRYEELVNDQENVTRRILEFCELEWDDRCLQFHNVKRTIDTASYDQVRQPLYTKSVQRWRRYERYLDDLKSGLERGY
jgi:tetratricopeptide (TPR) repeat protein